MNHSNNINNTPQISPGSQITTNSVNSTNLASIQNDQSRTPQTQKSGDTGGAPFIIQNGNVYQLTSNNQLISTNTNNIKTDNNVNTTQSSVIKNAPASNLTGLTNTNTKNVILNSLQQGNLNQRIKMTTVNKGTVLNLNTSKVVYKTIDTNPQQQKTSINIVPSYTMTNGPNQSKQIIIQGNNTRLSSLINGTNNANSINGTNKSVIVLNNSQNQRLNQTGEQNSIKPPPIQYIIQQKQPNNQNELILQNNQKLIFQNNINNQLSSSASILNNLNNSVQQSNVGSKTSLAKNKIQNMLEKNKDETNINRQNQQQVQIQNAGISSLHNDSDNTFINNNSDSKNNSKNVVYVLNNQNAPQNNQQIIKLGNKSTLNNQNKIINNSPTPPPIATNSILKAHLNSDSETIRQSFNESINTNSTDSNLKFALQSSTPVLPDQTYSNDNPNFQNSKLKNKEIVKITPIATNSQAKFNAQLNNMNLNNSNNTNNNNVSTIQSALNSPLNMASPNSVNNISNNENQQKNSQSNQLENLQQVQVQNKSEPSPKQRKNNVKKVSKENQKIPNRSNIIDNTNQNQLKSSQNNQLVPETQSNNFDLLNGLDENFMPSDEFLNDLLLPDTRIFASLLNKDLNSTKQNTNNNPTNKSNCIDLTYKTVMIGNVEHIILDNVNNLSDYRGDFAKLQTLACAVANKFNKPVTIPSFLLMKDDLSTEKIKEELIQENINPIVINNLECNNGDNPSNNIPNSLLHDNNIFQTKNAESSVHMSKPMNEIKKEVNGTFSNFNGANNDENNSNNQYNSMTTNSQNHYIIQSLQKDIKLNQAVTPTTPTSNTSNQQFSINMSSPMNMENDTNNQMNQPQTLITASKENNSSAKKATKPRKTPLPKNPNTPKRRKTVASTTKEKINQMPINQTQQSESLVDNVLMTSNDIVTLINNNEKPQDASHQKIMLIKKPRKPRSSNQSVSSLTKNIAFPLNQQPLPDINLNTSNTNNASFGVQNIDQNIEASSLCQQNIQIQNIANDLLKVKDEMQTQETVNNTHQMNLVNNNKINFINDNSNQIQQQTNNAQTLDNNGNSGFNNSAKLEGFQFLNENLQGNVNNNQIKNTTGQCNSSIINSQIYINDVDNCNTTNTNANNTVNSFVTNNQNNNNQANLITESANINEYDFNFDPFDTNVLFNLNDMEFI